jgi:hypothetical protein
MIDKDSDTSSIEGEKSGLSTVLRSPIIKSEETVVTVDIDDGNTSEAGNPKERFIPDHKKPDAAITFPEKVRYKDVAHLLFWRSRLLILTQLLTSFTSS